MSTKFYHGTTDSHTALKAGSWLTQIPTHAIVQAKKRAQEKGAAAYVLLVSAGDGDVRKPIDADRTGENRDNDLKGEGWVWLSTIELPVIECLTLSEAEQKFCGASNMLGL
jgi:hypothetical protein